MYQILEYLGTGCPCTGRLQNGGDIYIPQEWVKSVNQERQRVGEEGTKKYQSSDRIFESSLCLC